MRKCELTLLGLQSRFGEKPVKFQVVCHQNGTAVLKGSGDKLNPSRTAVPFWGQTSQIVIGFGDTPVKRFKKKTGLQSAPKGFHWLNPFRAAVPFRGQTSQTVYSSSAKRDCSTNVVKGEHLLLVLYVRTACLCVQVTINSLGHSTPSELQPLFGDILFWP